LSAKLYPPPSHAGPGPEGGSRRPILVVDDDAANRTAIRNVLEEEGYEVAEAANGQEAHDRLVSPDSAFPALMLLDLSMPEMTGWELLEIIKRDMRLAPLPVVLLSGIDPRLAALHDDEIAGFLRKPYNASQLLAIVERCANHAPGGISGAPRSV
jgi:CheY-like chemotaxis protein